MPEFSSLVGGVRAETAGAVTASSTGTTVTSTAQDTKGSYAQIIASTAFFATGFLLCARTNSPQGGLIDIAVGGAGSEVVILPNLLLSGREPQIAIYFPIPIPAGTRVSARQQAAIAGTQTSIITLILLSSIFQSSNSLGQAVTYGANLTDSGGVQIDPGGTAHTKGSYAQITASTTNCIRWLYICFGNIENTAMTAADVLMDIAIGAGGSEQVILADIFFSLGAQTDNPLPAIIGPIPVNIPLGTRIAARAQCTIIDATDRLFDVTLIGVG